MPAVIVVGLGYGDEGKGTTVDYLARLFNAHTVVRFNGGPQAGHNVVLPSGVHHCFSQWGAGTFSGALTYLSGFMLISPWQAFPEAEHLKKCGVPDPWGMLTVSPSCPIITPWHVMLNRMTEKARGADCHGTCGQGVGETMRALRDGIVMRAGQLTAGRALRRDMVQMRDALAEEVTVRVGSNALKEHEEGKHFTAAYLSRHVETLRAYANLVRGRIDFQRPLGDVIFEGAQGVLLDEDAPGFPHVTWSKCTTANADAVLEDYDGEVLRIGVTRTYMTRHGEGPLHTEAEELAAVLPEPHNTEDGWQGNFRRGYINPRLLRSALDVCGNIDALSVTHLDHGIPGLSLRWRPGAASGVPLNHADYIAAALGKPVVLESRGPTWENKRWNLEKPDIRMLA